uniref:Uncharacterized protein n=1 Tax=Salmonella sp. TaxID=599 RepID=A0A482EVG6_SALSP|nr:hypothetical protein NNIBIDOC_00072 [Salmonella sp.]
MRHISSELIALHDANISRRYGVRRECQIRVGQRPLSGEFRPELLTKRSSATWKPPPHTARAYIHDANKRTGYNSALLFLRRNGVQVFDSPELADCRRCDWQISVSVADTLRRLYGSAE